MHKPIVTHKPPQAVVEAFHGKVPRTYWRMVSAQPGIWSHRGRAARAAVQAVLRTVGLEMRLEIHIDDAYARRCGYRHFGGTRYQVGVLAAVA
jgi:hypothetical protein